MTRPFTENHKLIPMKRLVIALSIITYLTSCTKTDSNHSIPGGTLADFNAFMAQPGNGSFSIYSSAIMSSQDSVRRVSVGGTFSDGGPLPIPGGPVTVGAFHLPTDFQPHLGYYYDDELRNAPSLFGGDIPFDINPNGDGQITGNHATIFLKVPPSIRMTAPALNDTIRAGNGAPLNIIQWVPDTANPKNVLIGCAYYPTDNPSFSATLSSSIVHTTAVPDSGSYTLRPEDLAGFPEGSRIHLSVTRVAYTAGYSQDGTKKYLVYSRDEVDEQYIFE